MENKNNNSWIQDVKEMGEWYEKNIHTYQGGTTGKATGARKMYQCPLLGRKVGDDCSGFVSACLWKHGVDIVLTSSYGFVAPTQAFKKLMEENGFKKLDYDANKLEQGDIICKNGHVEIYYEPKKVYAWGNIHDGIGKHSGMPCWMAKLPYTVIWRKK